MKRYGALLALLLALASGLLAVVLANRWMTARGASARPQPTVPVTKVVIASKDLQVGTKLGPENLAVTDWPKSAAPPGALNNIAGAQGRVLVSRLRAGGPVLSSDLAAPGSGAGLVATIKPGRRAMAVKVDEVVGVGGFVLPNTFVDVIAVSDGKGQGETSARTLLQKVEVLAVAQETFTKEGKPQVVKTVTLEIDPSQAEKLALQVNEGPIHLALRNALDESAPEPETRAPRIVRVAAKPKPAPARVTVVEPPKPPAPAVAPGPPPPAAPPPFSVEIFRASKPPELVRFKAADSEERL
ncbi:MAG: Flp pilus assembly protein CpaB [Deltaproteobacteria bacterium]|nr:Flp pilus assembly protein CpaB [Deltaproteobacteria bacterium]